MLTIHQYFNEHILTFFNKRYKFTHRSFLLLLDGVIQFAAFVSVVSLPVLVSFRVQSYKLYTNPPNNFAKKLCKKLQRCNFAAFGGLAVCAFSPYKCHKIVYCICMYVRTRACVKNTRKKNFEKSSENIWWIGIKFITLHPKTNLKLKIYNYED